MTVAAEAEAEARPIARHSSGEKLVLDFEATGWVFVAEEWAVAIAE